VRYSYSRLLVITKKYLNFANAKVKFTWNWGLWVVASCCTWNCPCGICGIWIWRICGCGIGRGYKL